MDSNRTNRLLARTCQKEFKSENGRERQLFERTVLPQIKKHGILGEMGTQCPLLIRCKYFPKIMDVLLANGADINQPSTINGATILIYHTHKSAIGIRFLLRRGADPYIKTNEGFSSLEVACIKRRRRIWDRVAVYQSEGYYHCPGCDVFRSIVLMTKCDLPIEMIRVLHTFLI